MDRHFLRQHRLQKEFSQEYVAYKLNISQEAYSKIELGKTQLTIERLFEISTILEISVSEYLDKENPKTAK